MMLKVDGRILIDVVGFNKHHLAQGSREGKDPDSKKNTVRGTGRPAPGMLYLVMDQSQGDSTDSGLIIKAQQMPTR
jgi:hypothetical protein